MLRVKREQMKSHISMKLQKIILQISIFSLKVIISELNTTKSILPGQKALAIVNCQAQFRKLIIILLLVLTYLKLTSYKYTMKQKSFSSFNLLTANSRQLE